MSDSGENKAKVPAMDGDQASIDNENKKKGKSDDITNITPQNNTKSKEAVEYGKSSKCCNMI